MTSPAPTPDQYTFPPNMGEAAPEAAGARSRSIGSPSVASQEKITHASRKSHELITALRQPVGAGKRNDSRDSGVHGPTAPGRRHAVRDRVLFAFTGDGRGTPGFSEHRHALHDVRRPGAGADAREWQSLSPSSGLRLQAEIALRSMMRVLLPALPVRGHTAVVRLRP